ncbi:hypothetical protein [Sedimentibacter sp.]|uniref:hypothetical protein n=1 Tax=Sedimentibacter sp. TaxID=1960295 RepID=UPI0028A0C8C4|nr:hypothetical protein [Sedimentibacter sp.]
MSNENGKMKHLYDSYARSDVDDLKVESSYSGDSEFLFYHHDIPAYRVRELIVKKALFDAAVLLLAHGDSVVILSRNRDGSPSVLEYDNAGHLVNLLDFEYDD